MSTFRTTTNRVIGVLLDLERKIMQFWLNGKEQAGRSKNLSEGYWVPAVRIGGIDNCVILNPYGQFQQCTVPYSCIDTASAKMKQELDQYLESWVLVSPLKKDIAFSSAKEYVTSLIPTKVEIYSAFATISPEGKALGDVLVKVSDTAQFAKDCGASSPPPTVIQSSEMQKILTAGNKSIQFFTLQSCLKLREEAECKAAYGVMKCLADKTDLAGEIAKLNAYPQTALATPEPYEEEVKRVEYLNYTDKLLLIGKTSLKLLNREGEEKIGFDSKEALCKLAFSPQNSKEKIKLHLDRLEASQMAYKLNWPEIFESTQSILVEHLAYFLVELCKNMSQSKSSDMFMSIPYLTAKTTIDVLFKTCLQALTITETDEKQKELFIKRLSDPANSVLAKEEKVKPSEKQKQLSIEDLHLIVSILAKLDEQLWCLATAENSSEDVCALWDVRTSRIHTAYGRLSSFVSWPTNGALNMAEAGLVNTGDRKIILKHFMEPTALIENPLQYDQRTRKEIWSMLERNFPNNGMLRSEPSINVPLSVTLKYLPALRHTNLEKEPQEITHIESKTNSQYLMTGSQDGSVNVWGTSLRLFKVVTTNFKQKKEFVQKKKPAVALPQLTLQKDPSESGLFQGLFAEEEKQGWENEDEIELPPEEEPKKEEPKKEEKKKEEVKKVVIPKQEYVEQLIAMGFNVELAKKALINVNNESLEAATEALFDLQSKEPPKQPEKKVEDKAVRILSWACPTCTLINVEGKKNCEVCATEAPRSAYKYSSPEKDEKKEQKPEPPKQPDEAALKKEQEEKKAKELEEQKKLEDEMRIVNAAIVRGFAMLLHNDYPSAPFTLACALDTTHGSLIRVRAFKYATKYLRTFVPLPDSKGSVSCISDFWLSRPEGAELDQHLFGEFKEIIETYSPLFVKNQLSTGWSLDKTRIVDTHILQSDELDIPFACESIISLCSATVRTEKGEDNFLIVLGKKMIKEKESLVLAKIQIEIPKAENAKLGYKLIQEIEVAYSKEAKLLTDNKTLVVLVKKEESLVFDIVKLEAIKTIRESCDVDRVQILNEEVEDFTRKELTSVSDSSSMQIAMKEKTTRLSLVFLGEGQAKQYWLVGKPIKKEEMKKETSLAVSSIKEIKDYPEIKASDIGIEELLSYEKQNRSTRVGTKAFQSPETILYSSNMNQECDSFSKHNWVVCDSTKEKYEFTISSKDRLALNHIAISLTFTQNAVVLPQEGKKEGIIKVEESKESGVKEPLASGFGILSIRGGDMIAEAKKYHIPLMISSFKGAQYSFQNNVTRMLFDNNIVYASNYPKPQFIFCHQFGKRLQIDQFVVRTEIGSLCGGQPVGAGLIFISDSLAAFEHTNEYSTITTTEQYKKWIEQRKLSPKSLEPYEPVGFFEMGATTSITCDIDYKRPGFYLMLKPTTFRTIGPKLIGDFSSLPAEITYFGVIGKVLDEELADLPTIEHTSPIQAPDFITKYKLQMLSSIDGKEWIESSNIVGPISIGQLKTSRSPCNIDVRELLLGIVKPPLPLNRYGGLYKSCISDSRLQNYPAQFFKIVIAKDTTDTSVTNPWVLSSVSAESYIACDTEITTKTLKGLPASYLRICMSDPTYFGKFNKAIVELTAKMEINPSLRVTACQLLQKIIKMYPEQLKPISSCIDLNSFIYLNIYQQDKSNVGIALDLLHQLSAMPELAKKINHIILQDISTIPSFKLSASGFDAYFELLKWSLPTAEEDCITRLISSIHPTFNFSSFV